MSYHGMLVNDPNGDALFDSGSIGWLWVDSFIVGATSNGSETYNDLPDDAVIYAYGVPTLVSGGGHIVTTTGKTVNYTYFNGSPIFMRRNTPTAINVFAR